MDIDKIERLVKLYKNASGESIKKLLEEAIKKAIDEETPRYPLPYLNPVPAAPEDPYRTPVNPFPSNPGEIPPVWYERNHQWTTAPCYPTANTQDGMATAFKEDSSKPSKITGKTSD